MNRIKFTLDDPWNPSVECVVYWNEYIPCSVLGRMLQEPRFSKICFEYIDKPAVECGVHKHMIHVANLDKCLELTTNWSQVNIAKAVRQIYDVIENGAQKPLKKRVVQEKEEVIPQKKVRKLEQKEMSPWMLAYFEETKQEAIEQFKKSPEYIQQCAQIVEERVAGLRPRIIADLERSIRAELETELRPIVEAELTRQSREYRLKQFQLIGSQK